MTCNLQIKVLDSSSRATGNFYLSAITGLAGGEAVGGHGRPPAHPSDLRGVATPPAQSSPQPPHPLYEKSERDGIGLPDFTQVLHWIILSCSQKPPTARHPPGMLEVWNWQIG